MIFRSVTIAALSAGVAFAGPVDDARLEYIAGNYEAALEVLIPAAESGDLNAMNILGDAHNEGNGIEQDYGKTLEWWRKAATNGFSKSQFNLGEFWLNGRPGFAPDYERSLNWYEKAAAQGNHAAHAEIGFIYEVGFLGEPDLAKAVAQYELGMRAGHGQATANLGALYAQGKGVEQDPAQAHALTVQAARLGNATALSNLGVMYELGMHVAEDKTAAFALYKQAMARGDARAANNLASLMLEEGYFWSDPAEAYAHCLWSVAQSISPESSANFEIDCDSVAEKLSEENRAWGVTRAAEL